MHAAPSILNHNHGRLLLSLTRTPPRGDVFLIILGFLARYSNRHFLPTYNPQLLQPQAKMISWRDVPYGSTADLDLCAKKALFLANISWESMALMGVLAFFGSIIWMVL